MACDKCKDGIVTTIDDAGARLSYCDCRRGLERRYPGVPTAALSYTFESFPGPAARRDAVKRWLNSQRWLVLTGEVGTGKTSLASCAYKAYIDQEIAKVGTTAWIVAREKPCQWWVADELVAVHKRSWDDETVADPLPYLRDVCRFLVIDDLGANRGTEFASDVFKQLLGRRYEGWEWKRTIITTNWNTAALSLNLGDWVCDRLVEVADVLEFKGRSMRRVKR